jgi:hypothetical protein
MERGRHAWVIAAAVIWAGCAASVVGGWSVAPLGAVSLDTSAVSGVGEMSGVAYLGRVTGLHRFAAVQDSGNQLVLFTAAFAPDGTLQTAVAGSTLALAPGFDFEGLAYTNATRDSVYVSEESTPAIREYRLADGTQLQTVLPPSVFTNIAGNRGLESLTRSFGGATMWTANEEALTIDGDLATGASGTVVRLQQFSEVAEKLAATAQYAYEVDPVHTTTGPDRSGLADLVALPDGTLLALERSAAVSFLAPYESRLYQVDLASATDLSDPAYDAGLIGQAYTPVSKSLLWSGTVGGLLGENLEGLTLGPRIADDRWLLLGVVDSGDPVSNNTVVAFEATYTGCTLVGDYNCSGEVDVHDYTTWLDEFRTSESLFSDGNSDGVITLADYTVWRDHVAATAPVGGPAFASEPSSGLVLVVLLCAMFLHVVWRTARFDKIVTLQCHSSGYRA